MELNKRSYCDQILRVNLSSGKFEISPLPGEAMPLILGGKGLGAWMLYHEQSPGVDPLSPENQTLLSQWAINRDNRTHCRSFWLYHPQPCYQDLQRHLLWGILGADA